MQPLVRVYVLVDGFNLYHAVDELGVPGLKWLNLAKLAKSLSVSVSRRLGVAEVVVEKVQYFSAVAEWNRDKAGRHKRYIKALKRFDVECTLGSFKLGRHTCRADCGQSFQRHEEKQTDVNMALALALGASRDLYDLAIVISNDTDFAPAIQVATGYGKKVAVVTPPGRKPQHELSQKATFIHLLGRDEIAAAQFPDPVAGTAKGEKQIKCPLEWK